MLKCAQINPQNTEKIKRRNTQENLDILNGSMLASSVLLKKNANSKWLIKHALICLVVS